MIPNGSTEQGFKNSPSSDERAIYHRAVDSRQQTSESLSTVDDVITYLRNMPYADYAAIIESDIAKYYTHQLPCNLYMVNDGLVTKQIALGFPLGWSGQRQLNLRLIGLQESGVLQELEHKWFKSVCSESSFRPDSVDDIVIKSFYKMQLSTFSGAIVLLVIGIAAGALATLAEIFIYRCAETVSKYSQNIFFSFAH